MYIDIREAADLSERTKEDHGTVYIQGNIIQIEWDRPDTSEYPKLETWTYETDADAQAKFDEWTQGWYQEGVRDPNNRGSRNPLGSHMSYFEVGHKGRDVVWLYHDGEIKTAPGNSDHSELIAELGLTPKWPAKLEDFFATLHRGRYEPRTGKVSYISLDGHEMPSWLQSKLEEKFGDIEVETFANNGADGSFNAWISPKGKLLNLLDGEIKDAWLTHWEYANQVLGYADIHGAFKNGYVRVSIAPQGHSIIQARDLKKSLPVIQKALKDTYEKVGSIPIWVEDEAGEWDAETDLGKLVSATNLEELKELASNPESPSTDKILQTLEQEGYSLTDDVRLACWMTPDGEMINCSGDGRTRGIDHREISNVADVGYGNTAGVHRLMQLGFIRLKPEAPGFDLATAPTRAQRRALAAWLSESRGDEIFVEAYDTPTFDERNDYFKYARHESFEFERGENPGRILAEVESFYTMDHNPGPSDPSGFIQRREQFKQLRAAGLAPAAPAELVPVELPGRQYGVRTLVSFPPRAPIKVKDVHLPQGATMDEYLATAFARHPELPEEIKYQMSIVDSRKKAQSVLKHWLSQQSENELAENPPDMRGLGFSEDVAAYVEAIADKKALGKLFNQIRTRPEITLEEVQAIYQPTEKLPNLEQALYNNFEAEGVPKEQLNWIEAQLWRRVRKGMLLDNTEDYVPLGEAINNILDWANNDHIDLRRYTFEQANEAQLAYHEQCALADPAGRYNKTKPENILREYENGYTMQLLTSEHDFKLEGKKMGHGVGGAGYFKKFMDGRCKILSLRDEKNEPHVTIELIGKDLLEVKQIQGKQDNKPIKKYREMVREFFEYGMSDAYKKYGEPKQIYDEFEQAMHDDGHGLPSIVHQIIEEHYEGKIQEPFDTDPTYGYGLVDTIEDESASDFLDRLRDMANEIATDSSHRWSFKMLDVDEMSDALLELAQREAEISTDSTKVTQRLLEGAMVEYVKTGAYAPVAEAYALTLFDPALIDEARQFINLEQYNTLIKKPPNKIAAVCNEIVRKMLKLDTLEVVWEHPDQMRFTDEEGFEFNPPIGERLLAMGVHPDVVAYVDSLNEHPKIQGMLFKEFKEGKFEKLGDVMKFVEAKLPKGPMFDDLEESYIRISENYDRLDDWFKYQLPKLRVRKQKFGDRWEHNWLVTPEFFDGWGHAARRELKNFYAGKKEHEAVAADFILPFWPLRNIFDELTVWVNRARVDIHNYSWGEALQAMREWNTDSPAYDNTDEVQFEWPDGWKIVKVSSANNLQVEGNKMRHCVGSYADKVQDGTVEIVSLRDAKNEPHVTVEIILSSYSWPVSGQLSSGLVQQIKGVDNSDPKPAYKAKLKEFFLLPINQYIRMDVASEMENNIDSLDALENFIDRNLPYTYQKHSEYGIRPDWDAMSVQVAYEQAHRYMERFVERSRYGYRQHGVTDSIGIVAGSLPTPEWNNVEAYLGSEEQKALHKFDNTGWYAGDDLPEEEEQRLRDEALSEYFPYAFPAAVITKAYEERKKNKL